MTSKTFIIREWGKNVGDDVLHQFREVLTVTRVAEKVIIINEVELWNDPCWVSAQGFQHNVVTLFPTQWKYLATLIADAEELPNCPECESDRTQKIKDLKEITLPKLPSNGVYKCYNCEINFTKSDAEVIENES